MRRISTATAEADKHGTGKPGFTDEDPPTPATQLNAEAFDNYQEEICRAIEANGVTVETTATANYSQLEDAVHSTGATAPEDLGSSGLNGHVVEPMQATTSPASLDISLVAAPFVFIYDGRRYVITQAKLADATLEDFTLTASRDTYFFCAPEDPGAPSSPPDRTTIHIETAEVAVGVAAPATPAGTVPFMRIRTDGSGVVGTDVPVYGFEFFRGLGTDEDNVSAEPLSFGTPLATGFGGRGIKVHQRESATRTEVIPAQAGQNVQLGSTYDYDAAPEQQLNNGRPFADVVSRRRTLLGGYRSGFPVNGEFEIVSRFATGVGATVDTALLNATEFSNGTALLVEAECVASDVTDPTDSYVSWQKAMAILDGGAWSMEGSGVAGPTEWGGGAIAAGVTALLQINGNNLQLRTVGHSADQLEWEVVVRILILGPPRP